MNASARKAARILGDRRNMDVRAERAAHLAANKARTISTHVRKVAGSETVDGVSAALRKVAAKLRETGKLGKVSAFIRKIDGKARRIYRYTAAQIAVIAATYRPRKADYVAARAALLALAA